MPEKRKLLLVDDHPIILLAVKSLIESKLPDYALYSAASRHEALLQATRVKPALALVDLNLPDGDGLDLIRQFKKAAPACAVLVFSMQCELLYGPRAIKAGARGYVMKGDRVAVLFDAIRQIEAGKVYLSPALTERMARLWAEPAESGVESLTNREFQIFQQLAEGRSGKEVAARMGISAKTVDSHREKMKAKLGCTTIPEMMLLARDWMANSRRDRPEGA
jgi:DNA-binding NarL/FixJ family response regulator